MTRNPDNGPAVVRWVIIAFVVWFALALIAGVV